jgi:hypothetical protein
MIPLELMTGGVAAVGGFVMKFLGSWQENKHQERQWLMKQKEFELGEKKLLLAQGKGFAWTRRVIALSAIFSILVLPKLLFVFSGVNIPIYVPATDGSETSYLFGLFSSAKTTSGWTPLPGFPVFEYESHMLMAIVSFYFGSSFAGRK